MPSPPTEEEDEAEEDEEMEEEDEDEDSQGEQSKVGVWGEAGDGWERGHSLTLSPHPQDTPPPVPAPQTASPTEEDRMPPYDEQTQAFINGEG